MDQNLTTNPCFYYYTHLTKILSQRISYCCHIRFGILYQSFSIICISVANEPLKTDEVEFGLCYPLYTPWRQSVVSLANHYKHKKYVGQLSWVAAAARPQFQLSAQFAELSRYPVQQQRWAVGSRRNNSTLGAGNQLAAAEFSNFNIIMLISIHNIWRRRLLITSCH